MKRTNYILSEDQHETLQHEAERRGVSVSEVLRRIVDEWKSAKLVLVGMELILAERIDIDTGGECVGIVPAKVVQPKNSNGRLLEKVSGIRVQGPFHGFHLVFGDLRRRVCLLVREEQVLEIDLDDGTHEYHLDSRYFDPVDLRAAMIKRQPLESVREKRFW